MVPVGEGPCFGSIERAKWRRTMVFEGQTPIAILSPDGVEYRRWRIDRGAKKVVFDHHPDRLIRMAEMYVNGVPRKRVDILAPLPNWTPRP
jgi:hypothetical protein